MTAYVANSFGNQVAAIDTTTSTVMKMITVGSRPGAIAVTPDGKTAYVATCGGVVPVDTATNTAGPVIKGTKGVGSIAVTPDGKTAYLAYGLVCSSSTPDQVTAVDTATNTVIKQIAWKPGTVWGTSPIVISPDSKTAYIASTAGTLTPLDTTTNTLAKPVKSGIRGGGRQRVPGDHTGREDRLRHLERPVRARAPGDPGPHRHRQGAPRDQHQEVARGHRDVPGRQDRLRGQHRHERHRVLRAGVLPGRSGQQPDEPAGRGDSGQYRHQHRPR